MLSSEVQPYSFRIVKCVTIVAFLASLSSDRCTAQSGAEPTDISERSFDVRVGKATLCTPGEIWHHAILEPVQWQWPVGL